jgi:hypothetical protein
MLTRWMSGINFRRVDGAFGGWGFSLLVVEGRNGCDVSKKTEGSKDGSGGVRTIGMAGGVGLGEESAKEGGEVGDRICS